MRRTAAVSATVYVTSAHARIRASSVKHRKTTSMGTLLPCLHLSRRNHNSLMRCKLQLQDSASKTPNWIRRRKEPLSPV